VRPKAGVAVLPILVTSAAPSVRAQAPQAPSIEDRPLGGVIAFDAGATCLEQSRLESQVTTWLGRDHVRSDIHLDVRGDQRDPRALTFSISHSGRTHERKFDLLPENCDDATAVVALAVALAIDASFFTGVFAPLLRPPPPERLVAIELEVGGEVLPGASFGMAVGIEYGLFDWLAARVDAGARFSWGNDIDGTSGVFDTALAVVTPQLCAGGAVSGSVRLEVCSGAGLGVLRAQGRRFAIAYAPAGPWVAAQGGLRLRFKAGLSWVLDVQGVFPVHVPLFSAQNGAGTTQYRLSSPTGALVSAGPAFVF
jgi:hypothetical protein